ncbi:hypothetical protein KKF84_09910, partial [Myxococcota bacterium]|nr:hypothetical protein [Myxococcota bacterium]
TGEGRPLPMPVYALDPQGKWAVTIDFSRLNHIRRGYGYFGVRDPHKKEWAPADSGIWRIDLESGTTTLIVSLAQLAALPVHRPFSQRSVHYVNHLLFNTDGTRFSFLHRWTNPKKGWGTRLITASVYGSDLHVLDWKGYTSHYIWRDPDHILAFSRGPTFPSKRFLLFTDKTEEVSWIGKGKMVGNGHVSYLPGKEWILNDTYPTGRDRLQRVYLYNTRTDAVTTIAEFPAPAPYQGHFRVDTHPRFSPDGKKVCIDSAHQQGRQMYLINLTGLV